MNSQRLFCNEKLLLNASIKVFWYTNDYNYFLFSFGMIISLNGILKNMEVSSIDRYIDRWIDR